MTDPEAKNENTDRKVPTQEERIKAHWDRLALEKEALRKMPR